MSRPQILAVAYPAQGHVIPLLELSQCLARHGFRDRNNLSKVMEITRKVMSEKLEELIKNINIEEDEKIICVIVDGITIPVAEKMKIRKVVFWPAAVATLALFYNIPKLIDDGIIDKDGTPVKKQIILLAQNMPKIDSTKLMWTIGGGVDLTSQKRMFESLYNQIEADKAADYLICNSVYDVEPEAFTLVPNILPIGPLLGSTRQGNSAGSFWPEDSTCLKWLDQQQPHSVIYVAFGSFTVLDKTQFQELALGLELTNRPFLWVVRPDITDEANEAYPEGFQERVAGRGQLVGWAPQQKVLSHPSIACFFSHCGWNSTLEGVSNGLPFLCWPYFADQFNDESYICDIWKVGLKFNKDESGIITKEEIKSKVEKVLGDESVKARALELQETALKSVKEGGQSDRNFKKLIEWIKA
ncbi:UDP-glycosyltransferase 83A1-like [Pistacia vera]|uniref:UDP-glycosyltransferase 83A1-like n=1 Tax=Pistacia vera TaxID=55513 RepID=UPI0012632B00|nr:UDP-glycosyltransferase 83A1-like [Pistacia vera]